VTVTNCAFAGNSAVSGGGAARFNAHLEIFDSSFIDNQATVRGGSLSIEHGPAASTDPGVVKVTSVTFGGNSISSPGSPQGGGIFNQGYAILRNVTPINNTNGIFMSNHQIMGTSAAAAIAA
jgi:hypothetical protein